MIWLHNLHMDSDWFKETAKRLGLNQEDIGAAINVDRSVWSRVLRGESGFQSYYVRPLARLFGVTETEIRKRSGLSRGDFSPAPLEGMASFSTSQSQINDFRISRVTVDSAMAVRPFGIEPGIIIHSREGGMFVLELDAHAIEALQVAIAEAAEMLNKPIAPPKPKSASR